MSRPVDVPSHASIETAVADYYRCALAEHGATHRGVDWSSRESQELRFSVLLEGIDWRRSHSLLDYGCGYGALGAHLDRLGVDCDYVGYDIAPSMVDAARQTTGPRSDRNFTAEADTLQPADWVLASGIFNVKLDTPTPDWEAYVARTLGRMAALARHGFAFNLLPTASPPERARPGLYHADPGAVLSRCQASFGGAVSVREDYGLWEFTVSVSLGGSVG